MRLNLLGLCVATLWLTGCTTTKYEPVKPFPEQQHHKPAPAPAHKPVHHAATPVTIYKSPTDLVSKPFRDLGEVSGEDCQSSNQGSPANIATARKRMQIKASNLKANAILLHQCEVVSGTPGCYRQAVCQGSALKVSQ